jgi:signal transduction histidine kinase/ActR/RegA family two-component response regulator
MMELHAPRAFTRLRIWLILLVGMVTFLYAAATAWYVLADRRTTLSAAERQGQGNVRALAEHAARAFGEADRVLSGAAREADRTRAFASAGKALFDYMQVELRRTPQIRSILLVGPDGRVVVNSSEYPMVKNFDVSGRDYFAHHRDNPSADMFIGRPVKSRFNKKWLISLSRRLDTPDGKFGGVVIAAVEPEYFNGFYGSFDVGPRGSVYLFRRDGICMVRQPFDEGLVDFDFRKLELFRSFLPASDNGLFSIKSRIDGLHKRVAYRTVAGYPLVVEINLADDDILAPWRARAWKQADGGLVMILLASTLCWFLLRQIRGLETAGEALSAQVAERERAEAALRESEERLAQAQKMEAIGRLAGGVAHDFNNLLVVITGYTDLLLSRLGEQSPAAPELKEILAAGNRAAELTRQLLAFSRRQMLQPVVLDLNATVSGLEGMIRRLIGEDVALSVRLSDRPAKVLADPTQIEQVVVNLAVNARDAMPEGGSLTISTRAVRLDRTSLPGEHASLVPGPHVMLEVKDTGMGMSDEIQSHAFEPFFTTKEKRKGTGLGLSTVYGIVNQSSGHILLDSRPGYGSTFRIYLPEAPGDVASPPPAADAEASGHAGGTVLVAEDEESVRSLVRRILEGCGYEVLDAARGEDALARFTQAGGAIDLLVTDVIMPGMSGPELARRLRSRNPGLRILYMSGYTDDLLTKHGIRDADFIQKPFSPDAFARKVLEALAGSDAKTKGE